VGMRIWSRSIGSRPFRDALEGVLERNDGWWCDDKRTSDAETCAQQASTAFDAALDELQMRFGSDVATWRWGAAHQARSEHRPFSRVKPLARWFELRQPVGGDTWTVNAARVSLKPDAATGELYLNGHGPSLRAVYDVADPKNSRFVHSTGQSGIRWSPLYGSLAGRWAAVQDVPVWDAPAVATLVLRAGEP
jgi:penicillin G amidase